MEKAEFSETQFVIGYAREMLNTVSWPFVFFAPSTATESQYASDIVLKVYGKARLIRSEFYQFKRSKLYNKEVFSDLRGTNTIDTGVTPMYGFNIYNKASTQQFNVMQRLVRRPLSKVYYCAPSFHTVNEFNTHFENREVVRHSKTFDIGQRAFQAAVIPLNSNHSVIFNQHKQYICSDPQEIEGELASERKFLFNNGENNPSDIATEIERLLEDIKIITGIVMPDNNRSYWGIKTFLLQRYNIHWFPIFETNTHE